MKGAAVGPERVTRSVIIGTAGHIDHGKTALVYALTGTDTDRLPEEKRRGITIDLGFASMRLPDGRGGELRLSFIDVPGHHAFVRNMLAGAGGIDCALLVIAADEGLKAQTREHLAICSLLGIERGLVVLTKKDAVDAARLERTREQASRFLEGSFLRGAPVLAVSAKTGEGMAELREALCALAVSVPVRSDDFVPRLSPDRAFSMRGFGTVVTGTLRAGMMRAGSVLELQPAGRKVRVRGLQVHGELVEAAYAPCRAALNLTGVEAAEVRRGQMLAPAGTLVPTAVLDAEISLLPDTSALKHRARVRFHAFTADVGGTVLLYEAESLSAGATAIARLKLDQPQVLVPGDRFVLRMPSPAATIGGGRVLDAACRRGLRKADALRWLRQLREADEKQQIELRVERRGTAGVGLSDLVRETGLRAEVVEERIRDLVQQGQLAARFDGRGEVEVAVSEKLLRDAGWAIVAQIQRAKNGCIPRAELRSRAGLNEAVFGLVLDRLSSAGRIEGHEALSAAGCAGVDANLQKHAAAVEREYRSAGIAPPLLRDVAMRLKLNSAEMREAMTDLLRSKRLIRLGPDDLFIHCDAVAMLSIRLGEHRGERFDVARFKSFTGLTRKHAIPLLEYLDRAHVTRNLAGIRVVE